MRQGADIELIRDFYKNMSDEDLKRKIATDAHGLTPDAVEVIKEELASRHMDSGLGVIVAAQNKTYSNEDIDEFCRWVEDLDCPECKQKTDPLKAIYICRAFSLILFTFYRRKLSIGCPKCLKSDLTYETILTLFMGWWGIPWGPVRTIQTISNFFEARRIMRKQGTNEYIRGLILDNTEALLLCEDDQQRMDTILRYIDDQYKIKFWLDR